MGQELRNDSIEFNSSKFENINNLIDDYSHSKLDSFQLASKYNISRVKLYKVLKDNNIPTKLTVSKKDLDLVNKINKEVSSYLAGLIDGEGYVFINYNKKTNNYVSGIYIKNTDKKMLEFVVKHLGGKIKSLKADKPNHKDSYVWWCFGRKAYALLEKTMPYLITKCEQAKLLGMFVKTFEDKQTYTLPKNVHDYRMELIEKIKILNKRGK